MKVTIVLSDNDGTTLTGLSAPSQNLGEMVHLQTDNGETVYINPAHIMLLHLGGLS